MFPLYKKDSSKLAAVARMYSYMNFEKKIILLTAFVASKFGYSPLTFHSRKNNSKINHIYERPLRIVYNENIGIAQERWFF